MLSRHIRHILPIVVLSGASLADAQTPPTTNTVTIRGTTSEEAEFNFVNAAVEPLSRYGAMLGFAGLHGCNQEIGKGMRVFKQNGDWVVVSGAADNSCNGTKFSTWSFFTIKKIGHYVGDSAEPRLTSKYSVQDSATPVQQASLWLTNNTSVPQAALVRLESSSKTLYSIQHGWSVELSVSTKWKAGLPFIGSSEVTTTLTTGYSGNVINGTEETTLSAVQPTYTVSPRTALRGQVTSVKRSFSDAYEIPMDYTFEVQFQGYNSNPQITKEGRCDDGQAKNYCYHIFKGPNDVLEKGSLWWQYANRNVPFAFDSRDIDKRKIIDFAAIESRLGRSVESEVLGVYTKFLAMMPTVVTGRMTHYVVDVSEAPLPTKQSPILNTGALQVSSEHFRPITPEGGSLGSIATPNKEVKLHFDSVTQAAAQSVTGVLPTFQPLVQATGMLKSISARKNWVCGTAWDDSIWCSDDPINSSPSFFNVPSGRLKKLAVTHNGTIVGLAWDGSIWYTTNPRAGVFSRMGTASALSDISITEDGKRICVTDKNNEFWCTDGGVARSPQWVKGNGWLKSVSLSRQSICGVGTDDSVYCATVDDLSSQNFSRHSSSNPVASVSVSDGALHIVYSNGSWSFVTSTDPTKARELDFVDDAEMGSLGRPVQTSFDLLNGRLCQLRGSNTQNIVCGPAVDMRTQAERNTAQATARSGLAIGQFSATFTSSSIAAKKSQAVRVSHAAASSTAAHVPNLQSRRLSIRVPAYLFKRRSR